MKVPLVDTKNKNRVDIDNTKIYPTMKALGSRDFKKVYKEQVESLIFTNDETFPFEDVIPIMIIVEYMLDGMSPIYLETNLRKAMKRRVIDVLRDVISEHYDTLVIITNLYKGKIPKK